MPSARRDFSRNVTKRCKTSELPSRPQESTNPESSQGRDENNQKERQLKMHRDKAKRHLAAVLDGSDDEQGQQDRTENQA